MFDFSFPINLFISIAVGIALLPIIFIVVGYCIAGLWKIIDRKKFMPTNYCLYFFIKSMKWCIEKGYERNKVDEYLKTPDEYYSIESIEKIFPTMIGIACILIPCAFLVISTMFYYFTWFSVYVFSAFCFIFVLRWIRDIQKYVAKVKKSLDNHVENTDIHRIKK